MTAPAGQHGHARGTAHETRQGTRPGTGSTAMSPPQGTHRPCRAALALPSARPMSPPLSPLSPSPPRRRIATRPTAPTGHAHVTGLMSPGHAHDTRPRPGTHRLSLCHQATPASHAPDIPIRASGTGTGPPAVSPPVPGDSGDPAGLQPLSPRAVWDPGGLWQGCIPLSPRAGHLRDAIRVAVSCPSGTPGDL